jgi:hypothetical protein
MISDMAELDAGEKRTRASGLNDTTTPRWRWLGKQAGALRVVSADVEQVRLRSKGF